MPPRLIGSRWQSIGPGTIGLHLKGRNAVEDGQGEAFLMMWTPPPLPPRISAGTNQTLERKRDVQADNRNRPRKECLPGSRH
ncbi:hypothetical protein B7W85_26195 [Allorhizobium ampelinum]|nr:RES domain-containing protein [Agrobacterium vitis]MCF1437125.1 hypothetical protein [Allorhizobium ampelinum]MCF1450811.1 hypothetical protein [Allorhizobium ampelinum]MCF1496475.1 hypothetical protein [Allorhizobium ampelinum]OVE87224.1 hypothetical protein B7W85_26195 [Allorhizobium ampelinum]